MVGILPFDSKKWNGKELLEISKYEEFKEADIFIRRPAEALRLIRGVCGNCSCESKYIILTWDLSNGKLSRKRSQVPWRFTLLLAIIFYIFAAIMVVALSSIKIKFSFIHYISILSFPFLVMYALYYFGRIIIRIIFITAGVYLLIISVIGIFDFIVWLASNSDKPEDEVRYCYHCGQVTNYFEIATYAPPLVERRIWLCDNHRGDIPERLPESTPLDVEFPNRPRELSPFFGLLCIIVIVPIGVMLLLFGLTPTNQRLKILTEGPHPWLPRPPGELW